MRCTCSSSSRLSASWLPAPRCEASSAPCTAANCCASVRACRAATRSRTMRQAANVLARAKPWRVAKAYFAARTSTRRTSVRECQKCNAACAVRSLRSAAWRSALSVVTCERLHNLGEALRALATFNVCKRAERTCVWYLIICALYHLHHLHRCRLHLKLLLKSTLDTSSVAHASCSVVQRGVPAVSEHLSPCTPAAAE